MDSNRLGDDRLIRAIQTGKPVPGTPEQAAELVAMEMRFASRMATDIVRCPECNKLGPRDTESIYHTDGVCVKCGREMEKRDRNREYMSDGREGRDSFDRYCNEGDDE
jgi:DNA-directed RNA polymerase subunit RPC12/RpoP